MKTLKEYVNKAIELANGVKSIAGSILIASSYLVKLKNPVIADAMFKAGTALMTIGGFDKVKKWSDDKPVFDGPIVRTVVDKTKAVTKAVTESLTPKYKE